MSRIVFTGMLAWAITAAGALALEINEIRIDQPGSDNDEYFELVGDPGESLDGISYVVIGDGVGDSGVIEALIPLDGLEVPDDAFFLGTESTFSLNGDLPDLVTPLNFENSDNVTHLLVEGFSFDFGVGDDLDTSDDGQLDIEPWGSILDAISLVETAELPSAGAEHYYGDSLGFVDIGPTEDLFVPSHVYRVSDAGGDWAIGAFATSDKDTPGLSNSGIIIQPSSAACDFNSDNNCDLSDIDLLTSVGNLAEGVTEGFNPAFDLTNDNRVDSSDITLWLKLAGEKNGFIGPLLLGDANLDGRVDATDLNAVGLNWLKNGTVWSNGDFDGSGQVGPSDLNEIGLAWAQSVPRNPAPAAVPEPYGAPWFAFALLALRFRRPTPR